MFMRDNRLDVMTLLETWLDESVFDAEVFPDSSDLTRDRNRRDGGVAIVLSNNVYVIVYADFCKGHVESLWIECFLVADVLYCFVVFTDHPLVIIFLIILLWNMKRLFLHGSSQHWLFWVTSILILQGIALRRVDFYILLWVSLSMNLYSVPPE